MNFQLTKRGIDVMINAWSLLYDEINGTLDEDYPIMSDKEKGSKVPGIDISDQGPGLYPEDYDDFENPNPKQYNFTDSKVTEAKSDKDWKDFWKDDGYSITGNPYYGVDGGFSFSSTPVTFGGGPDTLRIGPTRLQGGMGEDHIVVNPPKVDDVHAYHYPPKPPVKLEDGSTRKYKEEESIQDLKDYVASTYSGHYTSRNNNVQTLDLIQSVGDAESFCRSNAIKYLSRYDKKGQAKRDILKAMHYCLLLYYFSGNTNDETPTRGYETF